jgi:exodeoxyribonuclease VII small subunit
VSPSTPDAVEAAAGPAAPDPADMAYEAARDELVDIVRRLESGGTDLEESLALWERGEALAARCQDVLDSALRRLDSATGAAPTESA